MPTRELCVQVTERPEEGGGPPPDPDPRPSTAAARTSRRSRRCSKGVEVVVGTPGRLIDLAQQGQLDLGHVRSLVLDEADEMLDLGFLPDVEKIVRLIPAGRQTMLFSATMPGAIITLARSYMHHPTHIRAVDPDDDGQTVKAVEQHVFRAHAMDKVEMLARILQADGRGLTLVFCRTKRTAAKVADELADRGFASGAVHGDLGQGAREQALRAFRNGKVDVLVATDVAARGIDVQDITHVVNYQCPEDEKTYLHRIGRTARAGATGIAITFVDWDDMPRWALIDKALDLGFGEPEETYSTSDHFYEELDIPRDVTGVLPRAQRTRAGLDAEEVEDLGETGRAGGARRPRRRTGAQRGDLSGSDRPERAERPERPRRERSRTRTRGGQPAEGAATTADTATRDRRRRPHPAPAPPQPWRSHRHRRRQRPTPDAHEQGPRGAAPLGDQRRGLAGPGPRPGAPGDRAADLRRGRAGGPAGLRRAGPARARRRAHPQRRGLERQDDLDPGTPVAGRAAHPRGVAPADKRQVQRRQREHAAAGAGSPRSPRRRTSTRSSARPAPAAAGRRCRATAGPAGRPAAARRRRSCRRAGAAGRSLGRSCVGSPEQSLGQLAVGLRAAGAAGRRQHRAAGRRRLGEAHRPRDRRARAP